jgi:hypothetical protein
VACRELIFLGELSFFGCLNPAQSKQQQQAMKEKATTKV